MGTINLGRERKCDKIGLPAAASVGTSGMLVCSSLCTSKSVRLGSIPDSCKNTKYIMKTKVFLVKILCSIHNVL